MDVFQLVAGKFVDDQSVLIDLVAEVKGWDADVPHEQTVWMGCFQNMIGQRRCGTLSLSPSDADNLIREGAPKQLCLGK